VNCLVHSSAVLLLAFCSNPSEAHIVSGVCSPFYASIKYRRANSHKGPGAQYKIACSYILPGVPVVVTAKYDNWRRIKDPDGDVSWIHKNQLSSKRSVIVVCESGANLMDGCGKTTNLIAHIKKNVIMTLLSVRGAWCKVEVRNGSDGKRYVGWIESEKAFGVCDNESL
jgi:SH3-like domain-containing protein